MCVCVSVRECAHIHLHTEVLELCKIMRKNHQVIRTTLCPHPCHSDLVGLEVGGTQELVCLTGSQETMLLWSAGHTPRGSV